MSKNHSFSIYLLKSGYNETNCLKEDTPLEVAGDVKALPERATMYILDSAPKSAWWKAFFEIERPLQQCLKGAMLLLHAKDRVFAITFGHVAHHLQDVSYEYDFGIRVSLNCLDPEKIKNTDTLNPSSATRQRTQVSIDTSLTLFDFDRDSNILRSLTGKAKDKYKELLRSATGSSHLRVTSDIVAEDIPDFCEELLKIYNSKEYEETFPDILKIVPVRDPVSIEKLDSNLLAAVRAVSSAVTLMIPDILDYRDALFVGFKGARGRYVSDDIQISEYERYLDERSLAIGGITIEDLKKHELYLADEFGNVRGPSYSVYKSLVFETEIDDDSGIYHLSEGAWYRVEGDYVKKLSEFLDPLCEKMALPPYDHFGEGEYNRFVADKEAGLVCLDQTNIAPVGQRQVEPCDLMGLRGDIIDFIHVKISTQSSTLSHLFSQGSTSIDLVRSEDESLEKLRELIVTRSGAELPAPWEAALDAGNFRVLYAIITHKDSANRSRNLPLFSRINLYRTLKNLRARGVGHAFGFIEDQSVATGLKKAKPDAK